MNAFFWAVTLGVGCLAVACDGNLSESATDGGGKDGAVGPCTPTSCQAESKNCGIMPDGCGGTLECGGCTAPNFCGGGGSANVCGTNTCSPKTCADVQRCGVVSDGCAGTLNCGSCADASIDASLQDADVLDSEVDAETPDSSMPDSGVPDAGSEAAVSPSDAALADT